MAKVIHCHIVGFDGVIRAKSEEEALQQAAAHIKAAHSLKKVYREVTRRVETIMRDVDAYHTTGLVRYAIAFLLLSIVPTVLFAQVPTGTVLPFYGNDQQLPGGFYFCNGDVITKTGDPDLYAHLILANPNLRIDSEQARLPDLRGEFLRGWDNRRNVDTNRRLGSQQAASVGPHQHGIRVTYDAPSHGGMHGWAVVNPKHPHGRNTFMTTRGVVSICCCKIGRA